MKDKNVDQGEELIDMDEKGNSNERETEKKANHLQYINIFLF